MREDAPAVAVRTRLLSLAYGCLGSLTESEDVVQEALLRFEQADRATIHNPEAWLITVVSRLAIDTRRSAARRRELYPGEWLPEPVFDAPSPELDARTRSRLSLGLLYLLEKLEPEQRVVFVLREVFENSYQSIADIVGKSQAACRQLMVRARAALNRAQLAPPASATLAAPLVERFIEALARGDEQALVALLAPDAVLVGDGGGKVPAALNPVFGADHVVRFFMGLLRNYPQPFQMRPALVNSAPGLLTFRDGHLVSVVSISIENDHIAGIYSVNNPDKISRQRSAAQTR